MFFHNQSSPSSLAPRQPAQKKIQNWLIRTRAAVQPLAGSLFMSIMLAAETGSSKNHSTIISLGGTFWLIVFCPHQKGLPQSKASRLARKGFGGGVVERSPASAHQFLNTVRINNLNLKKLSNAISNAWHFIKSARKPWRDQLQSCVFQAQAVFQKALLFAMTPSGTGTAGWWFGGGVGSNLLWESVFTLLRASWNRMRKLISRDEFYIRSWALAFALPSKGIIC